MHCIKGVGFSSGHYEANVFKQMAAAMITASWASHTLKNREKNPFSNTEGIGFSVDATRSMLLAR